MKAIILPSKNSNNLYIRLLKESLIKRSVDVIEPKRDTIWSAFLIYISRYLSSQEKILHIQWPTIIYGSRFFLKSLFLLAFNVILIVILKVFFKVKVIWTIHNNYAHGDQDKFVDSLGSFFLFKFADNIIAQQKSTLENLKLKYPKSKIDYVPHGNYVGAYGEIKKKDNSIRHFLGFKDDDIVLLSLGAIKKYKLNEKLIEAVSLLRDDFPKLKLIIIGKSEKRYFEELKMMTDKNPNIVLINDFIPDESIPQFLANCDYSVFYYDDSELTSGGIILSLSYGIPVITRNIAGAEIVDHSCGIRFEKFDELVGILKNISTNKISWDPDRIVSKVSSQNWDVVSQKVVEIYKR